jgi:RNA polymerase sigma factor (sigma-70 family)
MIEDTELLRRYVETRSEAAFAELVQRRIGLVYAVALRTTRNAHRAEDVTQTVFADLARKAASLTDRPVLAGWLYRSAHFAALGVIRAEQNRAAREQEAHTMHETLGRDEPDPEWEKIRPVLDDVMSELNERDRDAIMLRFFDGRPFADVGAQLRLSENSARMRVERALDKLHALLARRGIRSTTAALGAVLAHQATAAIAPAGLAATVTGSALASAPAAVTPAVSLLQFMSTSKLSTAAAGMVLVLGFGTAGYELHASRAAEASLLAADRENHALLANLADLRRQAAATDLAAASLRQLIDAARAAKTAEQLRAAQAAAAVRAAQAAETEAFMARHPEVRQAALDHWRAQTAGRYGLFFKSLGLTPAQIARFNDLSVQGVSDSTKGPNGELVRYSVAGDATEARKQMRELLGEEGYRRYREFADSGMPAWQSTAELAGALFDTATPLSPEQGEEIFHVLAEGKVATAWSSFRQYDWSAIMPQARRILSEPQLATLEIYRAADEYSQAATQVARRNQPPPTTNAAGARK